MTDSQTKKIKKHLESGKRISALDALNKYGCFRLAARIYDLKKEGMNIYKFTIYDPSTYNYADPKLITFYKLAPKL